MQENVTKRMTYVSLFSSAGIGCYGFKRAHFDCVATCELIPQRMEIQKANNKCKYKSGYIVGDITTEEIKAKIYQEISFWNEHDGVSDIDVVVATPPCQGMSTVNYKKGDETKRNSLVVEAIEIIHTVKPKVFVFENVSAFLKTVCTNQKGEAVLIRDCIIDTLAGEYYIYAKVINFKDYGVPSSRPRTIVIGTRKDLINVSPLNIFPVKTRETTVREAISDLPSLQFGEISSNDIYHAFREYPRYMEEWISHIQEGASAFSNEEQFLPYKIENGKKVTLKGAYMGNKFRRLFWDRPCACIATRNDQLASQSTIHPKDNRVLSIRELMRLMTIPDEFKWTAEDVSSFTGIEQRKAFLKKYELIIRRCIGEAVPTHIMFSIASRIRNILEFHSFVNCYYKDKTLALKSFVRNFYIDAFIAEQNLIDAKGSGSYYTPQAVVFEALSSYKYEEGTVLNVLEPSVGLGAFLPQLLVLLQDCSKVNLDLCDIDEKTLFNLKSYLGTLSYNSEIFSLRYICDDFILSSQIHKRYDLIISNPPFFTTDNNILKEYRKSLSLQKSKNIFAFFLRRFYSISNEIITILPKSFLMAAEYNEVRKQAERYGVVKVVDFGVYYFKKVFIEIISLHLKSDYEDKLVFESKITKESYTYEQGYIFHDKEWLLYRNKWFDNYISTLKLGVFSFFRDRQLTNKYLKDSGEIRVLRSKNILDNGDIIEIEGYDKYIDNKNLSVFAVSKFLNTDCIIMPNFTYNTRATRLPCNCIPNGSIAILVPHDCTVDDIDLTYYSTDDFRQYYAIVKNNAKYTINIDNNSIYYIGVLK